MARDSSARPLRVDIDARELRERLELAVARDDDAEVAAAARALVQHCWANPVYQLCTMEPAALGPRPEVAKRIASQFLSRCRGCDGRVIPGQEVFWTPGEKGVLCLKCGGKA